MPGKKLWERNEDDEDEGLEAAGEGNSWKEPEPEPDPEPEPEPGPVRHVPYDEGAGGRGGAYRLDENGNRVRVSGTKADGAREKNTAANKGVFAGRKHRDRPPQ